MLTQNQAGKSLSEKEILLRRISALESQIAELKGNQNPLDHYLPAHEALFIQAEQIAHLGSWALNLENNEMKWSKGLFQILGLHPNQAKVSFEKFISALHPDDREGYRNGIESLIRAGKPLINKARIVSKDGILRQVFNRTTVLYDAKDKPTHLISTVIDLTENIRTELEPDQIENQIRQAEKLALVGRVASGIVHDFNNLLTIISGNTDLLLADGSDERLHQIKHAGDLGATLTSQLLAFTRQPLFKPVLVNLNSAVQEILQMLGRLLGKEIKVRFKVGIQSALILADRSQVQQIILNLAINARDAMPGGGQLTFATEESFTSQKSLGKIAESSDTFATQHWVELTVQDSGMGMDANVQARAFDPFFTTKDPGKGTGLGLSTVKDIVAQSGGSVHIASQPGVGTKVTLRFPRHFVPEV